jgi:hypothetical protein
MGAKNLNAVLVKVVRDSCVHVNDNNLAHNGQVNTPLKPLFNCSPSKYIRTPHVSHTYTVNC